jgi:hypothetical protein
MPVTELIPIFELRGLPSALLRSPIDQILAPVERDLRMPFAAAVSGCTREPVLGDAAISDAVHVVHGSRPESDVVGDCHRSCSRKSLRSRDNFVMFEVERGCSRASTSTRVADAHARIAAQCACDALRCGQRFVAASALRETGGLRIGSGRALFRVEGILHRLFQIHRSAFLPG